MQRCCTQCEIHFVWHALLSQLLLSVLEVQWSCTNVANGNIAMGTENAFLNCESCYYWNDSLLRGRLNFILQQASLAAVGFFFLFFIMNTTCLTLLALMNNYHVYQNEIACCKCIHSCCCPLSSFGFWPLTSLVSRSTPSELCKQPDQQDLLSHVYICHCICVLKL